MLRIYLLAAALLLAHLLPAQSVDIAPAVQSALQRAASDEERIPCILLLRQQADLSAAAKQPNKTAKARYVFAQLQQTAQQTQAPLLAALQALPQAAQQERQAFYIVNAIALRLRPSEIRHLQQTRLDIARILPSLPIQAHQPPRYQPSSSSLSRSSDTLTWGIERIQAERLWALGIQGNGVIIGGQDTGYDWLHPAITDQYRGNHSHSSPNHNYSWHDAIHGKHPLNPDSLNPCGFNALAPCDDGSHGTHTMGTMVGSKADSTHIGVAPAAQWIGCRNMERGWGRPESYIECFQWFLAPTNLEGNNPQPELAPHVINNSWGCPPVEGCDVDNFEVMRLAVANLRASGVVVVVSAGNDGPDCATIANPAAIYGESFSIGATDAADTVIFFSSRGVVEADGSRRIKPNVVAPGVSVLSCTPNGNFGSASGTSMAGPHVAALVALLISADPSLAGNVERIEELIEKTAQPVVSNQICGNISPNTYPNPVSGHGRVDAWAALAIIRPDLVLETPESRDNLRLFPNPTEAATRLILPFDADESTSVEIFTPLGQKMLFIQPVPFSRIVDLDLRNLPKGTYLLTVSAAHLRRPYHRVLMKSE